MKRISTCALVLFAALMSQTAKAEDFDLYIVGLEDGGYTSLDVANLRSLRFEQSREADEENVSIYVNRMCAVYADGTSKSFDLASFSSIQFDATAVGIDEYVADTQAAAAFGVKGSQLTVHKAGQLSVSMLDGRHVVTMSVAAGSSVDLGSMPSGIYIVNLCGQTAKILVK